MTPSVAARSATWALGELVRAKCLADSSHGDLLFLSYKPLQSGASEPVQTQAQTTSGTTTAAPAASASTSGSEAKPTRQAASGVDLTKVDEPEVDQYWRTQDGKIERKRDAAFCRHGDKAMCDYCMPLEVSLLLSLYLTLSPMTPSTTPRTRSNTSRSTHTCASCLPDARRRLQQAHPSTCHL